MARRHRHARASLIDLTDAIEISEVELGVNAMHVEIERDGYDVEVAGAFAVAKEGALDAVRAGEQAQFRRRHSGAAVVVRVQADDERVAVLDVAANPLDMI